MNTFRRARAYLPRYRLPIAAGLVAIPLSQGLSMTIPWLIGRGIDELRADALTYSLRTYFLVILVLAAVRGVAKFAMRYYIVGVSRYVEEDLRSDLFRHLLKVAPDSLGQSGSGDLMTRLTWDVEAVRMFLGPGVMYLTETLLILPPALIVLLWFDPILALLMLLPLVIIVTTMKVTADPVHRESQLGQERLSDMSDLAQESFSGVRVIRAFAREREAAQRFEGRSRDYAEQMIRVAKIRGISWVCMMAAKDFGILLLIGGGCVQMIRGEITVGQFLIFNMYLGLLFWPMIALGWMIAMYQRAKVSMERIDEIFDRPAAIPAGQSLPAPPNIRGEIELRDLSIQRAGTEVLDRVSLRIPAGQTVGITGPVGSGKTTLVESILRLTDTPAGSVFLDGQDVTTFDAATLREAIGYVPQDSFLFADSLRSNLRLGREDANDPQIIRALEQAQIADEILSIPKGLDAIVGERGVTLSGGQRQRTTIARALLKDPPILILDDCLSAVDAETEANLLAELAKALAGRTTVIISHRVAPLTLADIVVVLEEGRITEEGSVDDLLRKKGVFYAIHQRQRAEAELEQLG